MVQFGYRIRRKRGKSHVSLFAGQELGVCREWTYKPTDGQYAERLEEDESSA